jgi:hypothetical protein
MDSCPLSFAVTPYPSCFHAALHFLNLTKTFVVGLGQMCLIFCHVHCGVKKMIGIVKVFLNIALIIIFVLKMLLSLLQAAIQSSQILLWHFDFNGAADPEILYLFIHFFL